MKDNIYLCIQEAKIGCVSA